MWHNINHLFITPWEFSLEECRHQHYSPHLGNARLRSAHHMLLCAIEEVMKCGNSKNEHTSCHIYWLSVSRMSIGIQKPVIPKHWWMECKETAHHLHGGMSSSKFHASEHCSHSPMLKDIFYKLSQYEEFSLCKHNPSEHAVCATEYKRYHEGGIENLWRKNRYGRCS